MVWDNTQIMQHAHHHTTKSQNKMVQWENMYAVLDRLQAQPTALANEQTITATDLPVTTFLPGQTDREFLVKRMSTIVERILVQHIPFFKVLTHN